MAPGVTLAVIGAILTFAIRTQPSGIDLRIVGLILMLAGGGLIWHSLAGTRRERTITRVQNPQDYQGPGQATRETIEERDIP